MRRSAGGSLGDHIRVARPSSSASTQRRACVVRRHEGTTTQNGGLLQLLLVPPPLHRRRRRLQQRLAAAVGRGRHLLLRLPCPLALLLLLLLLLLLGDEGPVGGRAAPAGCARLGRREWHGPAGGNRVLQLALLRKRWRQLGAHLQPKLAGVVVPAIGRRREWKGSG
jgi:hypothetical protein